MIARALYRKPEIIFFDEATSALDIENEKKILDTIQSLKKKYTIIISTHRSETLSICEKVFDINNNKQLASYQLTTKNTNLHNKRTLVIKPTKEELKNHKQFLATILQIG